MIAAKSRMLTPRVRCEMDKMEGIKRVNASRMQNAMVAFNAVKSAFDKELSLRKNFKDEISKIVKADVEVLREKMGSKVTVEADVIIPEVEEDETK